MKSVEVLRVARALGIAFTPAEACVLRGYHMILELNRRGVNTGIWAYTGSNLREELRRLVFRDAQVVGGEVEVPMTVLLARRTRWRQREGGGENTRRDFDVRRQFHGGGWKVEARNKGG